MFDNLTMTPRYKPTAFSWHGKWYKRLSRQAIRNRLDKSAKSLPDARKDALQRSLTYLTRRDEAIALGNAELAGRFTNSALYWQHRYYEIGRQAKIEASRAKWLAKHPNGYTA